MPLVSVIVPVYKVEKYLHRCIDSILCQTYPEFELILVDDGSPDRCPQICDEYASKDKRIRVVHKSNGGQSSARNAGLDICKGDYIYFCDSDDWIEPNLLELVIGKIISEKADMVRFQCFTHFADVIYRSSFIFEQESGNLKDDETRMDFICKSLLTYQIGWELWLAVYRADTLLRNDVRFPEGMDIAEDLFINILDIVYSKKITFLDEPLYHYCMRDDSTMGNVKGKIRIDACNELAYQLYKNIHNDYISSRFFRIHNMMLLNEMMGHLPTIKNKDTAQSYIDEVGKISRKEFLLDQLSLAARKVDYTQQDGFYRGNKKNALNRYLVNHRYYQYFFRVVLCEFLYLPVRITGKIKRMTRAL